MSRSRQSSTSNFSYIQDAAGTISTTALPPKSDDKSKAQRKRTPQIYPLSTVPNVYFEEDFHLENPRTFDIVSERAEIVRPPHQVNGQVVAPGPSGRKSLATNAILQEKLSWYMDTVEVHLINSISTASTSFFAALGDLKELHSEATDSVAKIKSLREDLANLDTSMALGGLKIINMHRRQGNVRKLNSAIQQLRCIVETVSHCEEQIEKNHLEQALGTLSAAELLIIGQEPNVRVETHMPPTLINLSGIRSLEGAEEDLLVLKRRIGKGYEGRLLEALLGDLRRHIDTVEPAATLLRWVQAFSRGRGTHMRAPSNHPAYLQVSDDLRKNLHANIQGLSDSECVMNAMGVWRESVLREFKAIIRRQMPSSSEDDTDSTMSASTVGGRHMTQQEKSSIIARNLRAMDSEDSYEMIQRIYTDVGEALRRVATQVKILLDLTSGLKKIPGTPSIMSPKSPPAANMTSYLDGFSAKPSSKALIEEDLHQALDMSNILGQAVDSTQAQMTKVLKVRSEQVLLFPLPLFLQYFHLNRTFADECEAVSGRGGDMLKTVVNSQIKDFVAHFAETQRRDMVEGMDSDKWDARDFTEPDAEILSRISRSSTEDIRSWQEISSIVPANSSQPSNLQQVNGNPPTTPASKIQVRSAMIDEQKYILPSSAIKVLHSLELFAILCTGVPSLVTDIAFALLEYLRLYNSRSQQLILGAGATLSAGLKNITTKHLALANQALSFIGALMPYVREFIRRYAANATGLVTLMTEFDKVKRLYAEHQAGIQDKLVEIMSGRATTHVNAMKKVQWDDGSQGAAVSPYMETLVKETTTLHKVLSKHLPDVSVEMVMQPVFASYKEQWSAAFQGAEVKTEAGKERMLRDAEHFKSRLAKIQGGESVGEDLVKTVREKVVKGDASSDEQGSGRDEKTSD